MRTMGIVLTLAGLCLGAASCQRAPEEADDDAVEIDAGATRAQRERAAREQAARELEATRVARQQEALRAAEEREARARAEAAAAERAEAAERARVEAERLAFEARWPLYGVAFHFLARVYAAPNINAPVVGYLRRGARFRAGERVPGTGCARGFYPVPGDGFVCRGEGTTIGRQPQSFEPAPTPPAIDDALPYAYVWVARDREPEFWRLPTVDEEEEARAAIARRAEREAEAEHDAATDAGAPRAEAQQTAEGSDPAGEEAAGDAPDAADDGVEAPPPPGTGEPSGDETSEPATGGDTPAPTTAPGPGAVIAADDAPTEEPLPSYLRRVLRRGFYLSIDHEERDGARRFLRTIRGGYVRADAVSANEPPTHRGVVLGGSWRLPVAFVYRGGTRRLRRAPSDGRLSNDGTLERLTPFPVAEEITRRGRPYAIAADGFLVRSSSLRIARRRSRPDGVGEGERWIHVDLDTQTLVAYDGDEPRFATVVSTGREGHETPTGLFHIQSKHLSTTMDDLGRGEDSYLIEDVPWTMYFEGNFALHAAFWHSAFGRVKSHGCVNLAPADARFLFTFSQPELPASWHGGFARRGQPGTAVWITGPDPAPAAP